MTLVTNNKLTFNRTIKDNVSLRGFSKFLGLKDDDFDTNCEISVEYTLNPVLCYWGISSIHVNIEKISGVIAWSISGEYLNDNEKAKLVTAGGMEMWNNDFIGSVSFNADDTWKIENELKFAEDACIIPSDVEIDFNKRTVTIS